MEYSIPEINNGVAKVVFSDESWIYVELSADMTEADLDYLVHRNAPANLKTGEKPSFLSVGATRTAAAKESTVDEDSTPDWFKARVAAYGSPESQIEYITENGIDAWVTKVAQIKTDNPKS